MRLSASGLAAPGRPAEKGVATLPHLSPIPPPDERKSRAVAGKMVNVGARYVSEALKLKGGRGNGSIGTGTNASVPPDWRISVPKSEHTRIYERKSFGAPKGTTSRTTRASSASDMPRRKSGRTSARSTCYAGI